MKSTKKNIQLTPKKVGKQQCKSTKQKREREKWKTNGKTVDVFPTLSTITFTCKWIKVPAEGRNGRIVNKA